jgi:hypothetical protein
MTRFNIKKAAALTILFIQFSSILFFFQNCAKVNFSKELPIEMASKTEPLAIPTVYEPPVTPAGPTHGDIVGSLKPFTIEEQKIVPKTKILIVVDNSGSMKNSQNNLAKGLDSIALSLQNQIADGLNPEVEFYIVTTTVPEMYPSSLDFLPTLKDISVKISNSQSATFKQISLKNSNSVIEKNIGLDEFKSLANSGEILLPPVPLVPANEYDYITIGKNLTALHNSPFYLSYQNNLGFDLNKDISFTNDGGLPKYVRKDGTALRYIANFDMNTNYPGTQNGSYIPFVKVSLNSSRYLVNPDSADRQFDTIKFANFRDELKKKITAVTTTGSNKEMGLCALHRSLTMGGENQIFSKNDRAAFLIISDEQDAQTTWNECLLQSEIGNDIPSINTVNFVCKAGDNCLFPTKAYDYSATLKYGQVIPADNSPKQVSVYATGSFSKVNYYMASSQVPTGQYYLSHLTLNYAKNYTYMTNSEGQLTTVPNDGKNGRPLIFDMKGLNLDFRDIDNFLISNYTTQKALSLSDATLISKNGSNTCRPEDYTAALNGFLTSDPAFASFYNSLTAEAKPLSFRCINAIATAATKYVSTPTTSTSDNFFAATLYTLSRYVSNGECQIIKSRNSCYDDTIVKVKNAICNPNDFSSICSKYTLDSCVETCIPGAPEYTAKLEKTMIFKSQDPDFVTNFKPGYNLPFEIREIYVYQNQNFTSYSSYEDFVAKNPDKLTVSFTTITKQPEPTTGTRSLKAVTNYLPYSKMTDIADRMKSEGFNFVAAANTNLKAVKEQIVSSFHMRAKNLFNNNYFISSIVIPNDNTYPTGRCPGVPDQESQSPGSDYLTLLNDIYFTKIIQVNGQQITEVDSDRKAFADICKEDFSAALEPLKNFISKVAKNRYQINIPVGREIHSIETLHNGKKKNLINQ